MSNEPIEIMDEFNIYHPTESTRGNNGIVNIDEHAFIEDEMESENTENTLSYSEQLHGMVKGNHHKLNLESQLLQAKTYFKKRSKNELLDLYFSMNKDLKKSQRKPLRNLSKADLIVLVIKSWLKHKQEEIRITKELGHEIEANPELEQAMNTAIIEMADYQSNADLPDEPNWDGSLWESNLDSAIEQGYKTMVTPDGSRYTIVNRDQVIGIPNTDKIKGWAINRNGGEATN